jgi:hypothetical protein
MVYRVAEPPLQVFKVLYLHQTYPMLCSNLQQYSRHELNPFCVHFMFLLVKLLQVVLLSASLSLLPLLLPLSVCQFS